MPKDEFDPEDPMELVGVEVPVDPDLALQGIVQEYLMMGFSPARILLLFRSPYYGATHQIYVTLGHKRVRDTVYAMSAQWRQGWLASATPSREGGNTDA